MRIKNIATYRRQLQAEFKVLPVWVLKALFTSP